MSHQELAEQLGNCLKAKGLKLSVAESCTGGGLSDAITSISGCSDYFDRGFVTYSNVAKVEMLRVPQAMLDRYGAVSEEVARAMAEGAKHNSSAQITIAITGIAGPGGGTIEKPVGTVCFAWLLPDHSIRSKKILLKGDRAGVRKQSVEMALSELLAFLIKINL